MTGAEYQIAAEEGYPDQIASVPRFPAHHRFLTAAIAPADCDGRGLLGLSDLAVIRSADAAARLGLSDQHRHAAIVFRSLNRAIATTKLCDCCLSESAAAEAWRSQT